MIAWIIYAVIVLVVVLYCFKAKTIGHVPDFRKPFSVALLVVYTIIMLVCCSCGSSKSLSKQELSIESGSQTNRKDTASLNENIKKVESEDITEEVEEVTTVYDTNKPADPLTGKRPILSETKKNTKRESNKKRKEISNITLNQSSTEQLNDSTKIKEAKEEQEQRQETTVPRQIGGIFWALAVLIGLVIVGYILVCKMKKQSDL